MGLLSFDIIGALWSVLGQGGGMLVGKAKTGLPYSVGAVRDGWRASGGQEWMIWVLPSIGAVLIGYVVFRYYRTKPRQTGPVVTDDPEGLFDELLGGLSLEPAEKKLLRQIASGARLRHPSMCLLSPGLLAWAGKVWQREKGPGVATAEHNARIDTIAVKLYDHRPIRAEKVVLCES